MLQGTGGNFFGALRIGVNAAGLPFGNASHGIRLADSESVWIGRMSGGGADRPTVIGANGGDGIRIDRTSRTIVEGSFFGVLPDGTARPNAGNGMSFDSVAVGHVFSNTIAHNGADGVRIIGATARVRLDNDVHSNGELGIDVGDDGVTPNDPLDADEGPNRFQNAPVITSVTRTATASEIRGTINSTPSTILDIIVFASSVPDPSGSGEGQQRIGRTSVTTDANGHAAFVVSGPVLALGQIITATAGTPQDFLAMLPSYTSEFSAPVVVANPSSHHDVPTLSEWMLLALALGLVVVAARRV